MLWSQRARANTQERQTFPCTSSKWKEPKWWMHSILILLFCYYKSPNPSDITCHTATELTGNLEMYPVFCHPAPPQVMRLHAYCFLYLRKLILFCSVLLFLFFFHLVKLRSHCLSPRYDLPVNSEIPCACQSSQNPRSLWALGSLSPPSKWKHTEGRKSIPATSLAIGFRSAG